jgi:hypothetical protein
MKEISLRKGGAFPHCAAAEPQSAILTRRLRRLRAATNCRSPSDLRVQTNRLSAVVLVSATFPVNLAPSIYDAYHRIIAYHGAPLIDTQKDASESF